MTLGGFLQINMKTRLYTFGCSFTEYRWPTWADIVGRDFDIFENWGHRGAGNSYILYSLMECIKRNAIDKNDTVVIMWTSVDRFDRWINGEWKLEGGVFNNQDSYSDKFLKEFADPTGFLIRDMSIISAARTLLTSIGCDWHFLSTSPLDYKDKVWETYDTEFYNVDQSVFELYKDELNVIKPSVFSTVFANDWYSRPGFVDLSILTEGYNNLKGSEWPSLQDFKLKNFEKVTTKIKNEMFNLLKLNKHLVRTDFHPTPLEHLEYIQKVLPEFHVSQSTVDWTTQYNNQILSGDLGDWKTNTPVERF